VTVPNATVLLNAVTIVLLFVSFVPFAGAAKDWVIKVKLPDVLVEIFVKVLLLIVVN
jgi:hypothetical protein